MTEIKYLDLIGLQRYDQKIKEVVNTGLDAKIGKDDVMLGSEELLSSWTGNGLLETPYMTNNWSARVEGMSGEYIPTTIYNENDEVIFVLPSFEELGARGCSITGFIYTHNNGELSILVELMDAPKNYTANIQIDPTSTYKLVFGDNAYYVKLTGDIYAELPTNTKKSFEKLNKSIVRFDSEIKELDENKADKISLNQHVLQFYELKGNVRDIESSLALKADKAEVESSLALKADKAEVESSLALKADKTEVESSLALKADKTEVESSLDLKADKTEVNTKIGVNDGMLNLAGEVEVLSGTTTRSENLTGDEWYIRINSAKSRISDGDDIVTHPRVYLKDSQGKDIYSVQVREEASPCLEIELKNGNINVNGANNYVKYDNSYYIEIKNADGYIFTIEHINVLNTKDSIEHLNNTLSTKITVEDLPTSVSQLSNDAGYAVAGDLKIAEVTEGLGENVAKAYKFEGGAESAVIEIPKDQTLKSVELGKIVDDAFVVDPTGEILRFTYIIADGSEKVVDVNVSNLITEAELDPVYDLIDTKLNAADVLTVSNDEIDAMFA